MPVNNGHIVFPEYFPHFITVDDGKKGASKKKAADSGIEKIAFHSVSMIIDRLL
jgi:hypothetical protein